MTTLDQVDFARGKLSNAEHEVMEHRVDSALVMVKDAVSDLCDVMESLLSPATPTTVQLNRSFPVTYHCDRCGSEWASWPMGNVPPFCPHGCGRETRMVNDRTHDESKPAEPVLVRDCCVRVLEGERKAVVKFLRDEATELRGQMAWLLQRAAGRIDMGEHRK